MIETNRLDQAHRAQIDRLYGDKERDKKIYVDIPLSLCFCKVCAEMACEVYGFTHVTKYQIRSLRELINHCWVHDGYRDCGHEQMTTTQKALYHSIKGKSDE